MSEELEEFYYPGSRTPRKTVTPVTDEGDPEPGLFDVAMDLLGDSVIYTVDGLDVEFFMIGQLAAALGRSATTLRRWESDGIIPKSGYTKPSKDPRGKRRLYSRAQVEGIIKIAIDEGVLLSNRLKGTQFSEKVIALFKDLRS